MDPYTPGGSRASRDRHPAFWEFDVQTAVHSLTNRGFPNGAVLLTGWDDRDDLTAVSVFLELDGPAQVDLELLAIGRESRQRGLAAEAFSRTFQEIEDRAVSVGITETFVNGYVWHENLYSQKACQRAGLVLADTLKGRQRWSRNLIHGIPTIGI